MDSRASQAIDVQKTISFVNQIWDNSVVPTLKEYISIPNVSQAYDPEFFTNGEIERVVDLFTQWVKKQPIKGLKLDVYSDAGRSPVIFIEVDSADLKVENTVLLYGHMDKQPPLRPWSEGLDPYVPVMRDGRLYGRGGADDGYAIFASLASISQLQHQNLPHSRCIILIESGEESGSPDLPYYVNKLSSRIGTPDLVVCLDSGCGNYDQLWLTTSLRGLVSGSLTVKILDKGVHSGHASGIVPSSFRIMRLLLDRVEDPKTGEVSVPELQVDTPADRLREIDDCTKVLGDIIYKEFPFVPNGQPVSKDLSLLLLNRTWKPTLSITGVDGMPDLTHAGNVLRSSTSLNLSFRIPPMVDAKRGAMAVKSLLESNTPFGAQVTFDNLEYADGWNAPPTTNWAEKSFNSSSMNYFGKKADHIGVGGSIPLINMLGNLFPKSEFCVTGVLGPDSNAHGPNEMLVIDCAKKVTCCISQILFDHYTHNH